MLKIKLTRYLTPFVQAQSNITREYGGTGLGLAISKGLIDLMEGEININSELGKGTIFTIQVDFETVLEDLNTQQAEQTADRSRNDFSVVEKPLLIAEDNPINQIVITKYLAQLGLKYELADNGQVACEKASNKEYALILMDIQMPVMDGLTASKILLNKKGFNTPIIAVSANAMKEDINKSIAMGISDHIAKPINFEELELALAKWLFQHN